MIQTISASRIKTYRICARKYYYSYILDKNDRPEQDKNIGALLGTALHTAIERRYRNNEDPIMVFQRTMDETLTEWESKGHTILGEQWYTKSLKEGKKMLEAMNWDAFHPTELEFHFNFPFPTAENPIVMLNGYIDLIDPLGYVVDHKSQRKLPTQDQLNHDSQLLIYAWAYKQLYGILPAKVYWNDLRTSKLIEVDVLTDFDTKLSQLTLDIIAMTNNLYFARKQLDSVCTRECSFYTLCYGGPIITDIIEDE